MLLPEYYLRKHFVRKMKTICISPKILDPTQTVKINIIQGSNTFTNLPTDPKQSRHWVVVGTATGVSLEGFSEASDFVAL